MSRRLWLSYLVLGWFLIGPLQAQDSEPDIPPVSIVNQAQEADNSEVTAPGDQSTEQTSARVESSIKSPPSDETAKDTDYYNREDLKAQRSMAVSTGEMAEVGWWQIGVGVGGLILIGITIRYARAAAIEAKRASDSLVNSERAHIFVQVGTGTPWIQARINDITNGENFPPTPFVFRLTNVGRTTAIVKHVTAVSGVSTNGTNQGHCLRE